MPRNKLLFNHGINLLPYTGAGSGITRALKYTPGIKFVNDEILNEFVVTVERKNVEDDSIDDRDTDREDRDNKVIHNNISEHGGLEIDREDRDNDVKVTRIPYNTLNGIQKDIVQFCSIPRSSREILDHIGYAYNSTNIANQIKPLLELGFIEMTEPDKPNSKNQKYRKVVSDSHSVTPPKHGLN